MRQPAGQTMHDKTGHAYVFVTQHISTPWSWSIYTTGADTVPACGYVRLLGVIISADLSLDRHVSVVSLASFNWLHSFDEFADHSTTNRQSYWFTPLLHPGSTIAICCWPEQQSL